MDNVPGIGVKRKKKLLKKYKTITGLKELSIDDLKKDLPDKVAKELFLFLKEYEKDV